MVRPEDLIHPRDAIMHAMGRVYRYRMTTTSGGNISARDDDGTTWITPAGVDKGGLTREDIVRVRPDGATEGRHRPSSELPFHRAIYAARPDLRAIVHAHPVALVAFSVCRRVPDTRLLPTARRVCGPVGFAPYALPGSEALGRHIAATFAEGFNCVVLENHGVVTGGAGLQEAFERFETLEFCAKTIIKAGMLGTVRYLVDAQAERPRPTIATRPEPRPGPATSEEKELRRQLAEFVRRAYRQRLMISTQGAFSARLDAESFLVTPHRVDRSTLEAPDIVLVRRGAPEPGRMPSSAGVNHRAIYAAHPEIGAVVTASGQRHGVQRHRRAAGRAHDPRELPVPAGGAARPLRRAVRRRPRAGGAGLAPRAGPAPGERRRAGLRGERPGRLRPPGSAGVDGRGDDQQPPAGRDGADVRGGHRRAGRRLREGRVRGVPEVRHGAGDVQDGPRHHPSAGGLAADPGDPGRA